MRFFSVDPDCCAITDQLPEAYHYLHMPLSEVHFQSEKSGVIISQTITGSDYTLRQYHFFIHTGVTLFVVIQKPMLAINYMLSGSLRVSLSGTDNILLAAPSYQMFYLHAFTQAVWFAPGTYHFLHVSFKSSYLDTLAGRHPSLQRLLSYANRESKHSIPHVSGPIIPKVKLLLQSILHHAYHNTDMELNLRIKVSELILLYIYTHHREPSDLPTEKGVMDAIRDYIDHTLDKELRVSELAVQFGLSAVTLRRQFIACFRKPVYTYFHEKRMHKALQLLQQNTRLSIAQISDTLGYKNYPAFSRAFSKFYGQAPRSFLRQMLCSYMYYALPDYLL